jgi:hypothetical protein
LTVAKFHDERDILFDRGGIPFVEAGDRFGLLLRVCGYGPEAPQGLRGLAKLVVVRLGPVRG